MKRLRKLSVGSGPMLGVRAIFLSTEKKQPYVNLPIVFVGDQSLSNNRTVSNILGKLATNTNGYVSFKVNQSQLNRLNEIYLYPLGHEHLKVSLKTFVTQLNGEGVKTIEISCDVASKIRRENIPSIQKADLIDHDFIPFFHRSGFKNNCHTLKENTTPPDPATGTGTNPPTTDPATANANDSSDCGCHGQNVSGKEAQSVTCEALLPDTQPIECMDIYQLDKDPTTETTATNAAGDSLTVQTGTMTVFESCFEPYGYSLGDLNYTVSLAPCESVNIAVESFHREARNSRNESTNRSEALENRVVRNKSVQEFIKSKLTEHKFNMNLSLSAAIPQTPLVVSMSRGYGFGSRKSATEMIQDINDTHHQLANSYSSYNSLVVQEVAQSELRNTTTRHLRNHNHCHTLNIMFYEVVNNIKVITEEQGTRPAVFVKYPTPCFTIKDVLANRHILREVLLDRALIKCLDDICLETSNCESGDSTPPDGNTPTPCAAKTTKLTVALSIADTLHAPSEGQMYLLVNGQPYYISHAPDKKYKRNRTYTVEIAIPPTCVEDINSISLRHIGGQLQAIELNNLSIRYEAQGEPGSSYFLFNQGLNNLRMNNEIRPLSSSLNPEFPPKDPEVIDTEEEALEAAQGCCENNLLQHLNSNKLYYYKILWMTEDANTRYKRFESYTLGSAALSEAIENTPLAVLGDWVAFPTDTPLTPAPNPTVEETFLYTPTGSLFSEAILGRCGGCEVIDNNVFWDWTDKQCPGSAPAIEVGGLNGFNPAVLSGFGFGNGLLSMAALSNLSANSVLAPIVAAAIAQSLTGGGASSDKTEKLLKALWDALKKAGDGSKEGENDGDAPSDPSGPSDSDPNQNNLA